MKRFFFLLFALALVAMVQSCQPANSADAPLKPIKPKHGDLVATLTVHGEGTINGGAFRDPITGIQRRQPKNTDSVLLFRESAYRATKLSFYSRDFAITSPSINGSFSLILIPGETLTLDVDRAAFDAPHRACYKLGGTLADINQVVLDNMTFDHQIFYYNLIPECTDALTFPEWSEQLWHNFDSVRHAIEEQHPEYTRRQRDFLSLFLNDVYLDVRHDYASMLKNKMRLANPDSALATLNATYTLTDSHAKDLALYRDGTTFYLPLNAKRVPYLEANGMDKGEVYTLMKGMAEAQQLGKKMGNLEVQPDDAILAAHPYYQPILRALNDTTRAVVQRLQQVADERIQVAPEVSGDQLLQTLASQHPGKVVFFDMWATWCGPCNRGIVAMEPLKEKLKGSDAVFIYITNGSSPEGDWKKQVADVPGLHYRVSDAQWSQIPNLSGIPQYYLYDRQGHRVWETVGFDDSVLTMIEQEIDKALAR